ncbi:MAG: Fpg/Nei family DNA glycosylase [Candidatus Dormibacteraceae bacterium]
MPELPELEALRLTLGPRLAGKTVTGVTVDARRGFMLRHPIGEMAASLSGRRLDSVSRRGKHLLFGFDGDPPAFSLVVNPMISGRFRIVSQGAKPDRDQVLALAFDDGAELRYRDLRQMGRIYGTSDLAAIPGWTDLGPEADSLPTLGMDWFRHRLRRHRDEVKDLLRNQSFLAGLGNAYSDEVCFEARILPLRRRATLTPPDEEALYQAIPGVLSRALAAILANPAYDESKQDRSFMAVHGKGGRSCARCGHRIGQLGSEREPLNFCRGCQR